MTELYQFQREGVSLIEHFGGRALLSDDMGLGKTIQALTWIRRRPEIRPVIVVCPAVLKIHWQREAAHHIGMRAVILEGRTPKELGMGVAPPMLIVNYDILKSWLPYLKSLRPRLIVADECHFISGAKSQRSRATQELCRGVPHVIAISGTPLTNRPAELYPVISILWPKLYPKFWDFASAYCSPKLTHWGWQYGVNRSTLPALHSALRKNGMIRRLKKDVLKELPAKQRIVVPVELENRKEYERAWNDFLVWLSRENIVAARKNKLALYLSRMTKVKALIGRLKLKAMRDWIDGFLSETDEKLIFFGVHRAVLETLHRHYDGSVLVNGDVTGAKRQAAIDRFTNDKDCRLFFGNIRAAGVGWNGTAASTVAFGELGWTPGEHSQAEDRPHRIGATGHVKCYYLTAVETLEVKLCRIIQTKQETLTAVLDGGKSENDLNILDLLNNLTNGELTNGRKNSR